MQCISKNFLSTDHGDNESWIYLIRKEDICHYNFIGLMVDEVDKSHLEIFVYLSSTKSRLKVSCQVQKSKQRRISKRRFLKGGQTRSFILWALLRTRNKIIYSQQVGKALQSLLQLENGAKRRSSWRCKSFRKLMVRLYELAVLAFREE